MIFLWILLILYFAQGIRQEYPIWERFQIHYDWLVFLACVIAWPYFWVAERNLDKY